MPSGGSSGGGNIKSDPLDALLAECMFSPPEQLPSIVQRNSDLIDDKFYSFIEDKIQASSMVDERENLRLLRDAITDIYSNILKRAMASQQQQKGQDTSSVQTAGADEVALATYDELIDKLLKAHREQGDAAMKEAVQKDYERLDMRFLQRLEERMNVPGESVKALAAIFEAITTEMSNRLTTAKDRLQEVLTAGGPEDMRKKLLQVHQRGGIDDGFVLLLQGNLDQARKSGAVQPAEIMDGLLAYASDLRESKYPPEVRLIRRLLRTDDPAARAELLMDSFQRGKQVALVDGGLSTGVKVDGKKFVQALRKLIEQYGNVDEEFVKRLSRIGEESEAVARKIYGMEGKDIKDLQNEAFHKRSVSIWDLEKVEMAEEIEGRKAAWEGKLGEIPKGFDEQGKMAI